MEQQSTSCNVYELTLLCGRQTPSVPATLAPSHCNNRTQSVLTRMGKTLTIYLVIGPEILCLYIYSVLMLLESFFCTLARLNRLTRSV